MDLLCVPLASLNDAGACDNNVSGSRTVGYYGPFLRDLLVEGKWCWSTLEQQLSLRTGDCELDSL